MAYHEYPKWITSPDGVRMIVNDAEHEAVVMGEMPAPVDAPVRDEKADLVAEATRRGIAVDKRWGVERLRLALEYDGIVQ